jgi:ATP-dependent DNA helicase RecG
MKFVDQILNKLVELIQQDRFADLETEALEIKPVPAEGGEWKERYKSINAFLNTRGGIVILGIKEDGAGPGRRYVVSGWKSHAEPNLKEIPRLFTDRKGVVQDLSDCFPPMELRDFLGDRIAVLYVDELAADRKFVFYKGTAYKRILTGDHKLSEADVEAQEEFKEEAVHARELQPVSGLTPDDLDLDKLNDYITYLNRPVKVETIKADLASALPFLERKCFIRDGKVTTLGALVCAKHPGDTLGFRCQVHGYVDVPQEVARDKQDLVDNVLPLMESSLAYILRNIQVGVSIERGGQSAPQYPEQLLRETVNNALAQRDYSVNKQAIIAIKPGIHIAIRNPGAFRRHLLVEDTSSDSPLRRILPEAKPRNPKLADVLRVYRKWEGRGIGMATLVKLVNLSLENLIDLPYYRFFTEEVCLHLCAGRLLDEAMERLFQSFDGYIESRLQGSALNEEQKLVLSYLIKSEWANEKLGYTILLTPDNNHFSALLGLERSGLIRKHAASTAAYPIYLADQVLTNRGYISELRVMFGSGFDQLDPLLKRLLGVVYRFNNFSKAKLVSAKQAAFTLWYEDNSSGTIEQFDAFYRKVRYAFNKLDKSGFVEKKEGTRGYLLKTDYLKTHII